MAVALSGGVDSAVAAHLLREDGHDVVALTLELWADPSTDGERSCCSPSAVLGARALAHSMGLPHFTLDLRDDFRAEVVDPFLDAHAAGRTPNPCVRCNGQVRFDSMLDAAERLGAGELATGHYARVREDGDGPLLCAAQSADKDQSYMLARLPSERLARLRFPLGEMSKPQVRDLARAASLPVAEKRESQDLCFVAGLGPRGFVRRHGGRRLAERRGDIVDRAGPPSRRPRRPAPVHGRPAPRPRRRGRGAAVRAGQGRRPQPGGRGPAGPARRHARERGGRAPAPARRPRERGEAALPLAGGRLPRAAAIPPAGDHAALELSLDRPVEAVAPGQAAVLLDGDLVVGEATIASAA